MTTTFSCVALCAEPGKAPALAAMGSLESYLYGNNLVDSGTPQSEDLCGLLLQLLDACGSSCSWACCCSAVMSPHAADMFYGRERTRFMSRVAAVGDGWVQFERALPYDVRLKWKVRWLPIGLQGMC